MLDSKFVTKKKIIKKLGEDNLKNCWTYKSYDKKEAK